jgi:hypothetical protein
MLLLHLLSQALRRGLIIRWQTFSHNNKVRKQLLKMPQPKGLCRRFNRSRNSKNGGIMKLRGCKSKKKPLLRLRRVRMAEAEEEAEAEAEAEEGMGEGKEAAGVEVEVEHLSGTLTLTN